MHPNTQVLKRWMGRFINMQKKKHLWCGKEIILLAMVVTGQEILFDHSSFKRGLQEPASSKYSSIVLKLITTRI